MMRARELRVLVSGRAAASMTDKMLVHSADPFPALTEMDVTVVALPGTTTPPRRN